MPDKDPTVRGRLRHMRRRVQVWSKHHIPPGLRLLAGVALMAGGVFGFLPVVGFWMFPLGAAIAALDVVPIWRWMRGRGSGPRKPD